MTTLCGNVPWVWLVTKISLSLCFGKERNVFPQNYLLPLVADIYFSETSFTAYMPQGDKGKAFLTFCHLAWDPNTSFKNCCKYKKVKEFLSKIM